MKATRNAQGKRPVFVHLILVLLLSALMLPGCQSLGSREITVLERQGFEAPEFWAGFAAQHPDVKVNHVVYQNDTEMFARARQGDFDIVHGCTTSWLQMVEQGLIEPLDTRRLENYADLFPSLVEKSFFSGSGYFVPVDWGYQGILLRADKVARLPNSWADLWRGEFAGHVSVYDHGHNAYYMAALALNLEPSLSTSTQDEAITNALTSLRPSLYNAWPDPETLEKDMQNGDVWLAGGASIDSYLRLKAQVLPVDFILPKEGALAWLCGYGVSSDTKNRDLAYDFMNAVTTPEANAWMSESFNYGPGNMKSVALMDRATVRLLNLDRTNLMDQMYILPALTKIEDDKFSLLWIRVMISNIK